MEKLPQPLSDNLEIINNIVRQIIDTEGNPVPISPKIQKEIDALPDEDFVLLVAKAIYTNGWWNSPESTKKRLDEIIASPQGRLMKKSQIYKDLCKMRDNIPSHIIAAKIAGEIKDGIERIIF